MRDLGDALGATREEMAIQSDQINVLVDDVLKSLVDDISEFYTFREKCMNLATEEEDDDYYEYAYEEEPPEINIKSAAELTCETIKPGEKCTKLQRIYCQHSCGLCRRK